MALYPKEDQGDNYVLELYISGNTMRSTRAIINIREVCEEHLKGRYTLEVVDLGRSPELAAQEDIIALPTLVKRMPAPKRQFVGDLSNTMRLLRGLEIDLPTDRS
jgi:circadian clock protein KaiB